VLKEGAAVVTRLIRVPWGSKWRRHFFYRKESIRLTWKLRLMIPMLVILLMAMTQRFWSLQVGQSLVCQEEFGQSDIILVENFNPDSLLFARAAELHKAGLAPRILVPVQASPDPEKPDPVSKGLVELMAQAAQMQLPEMLPIQEIEPIRLNAAYQLRDFLTTEHLRTVIMVTPGLRSQRSYLVHNAVFAPRGIKVYCLPVFGKRTYENWMESWHGLEEVAEQFFKLQIYRFYILRYRLA
jgi:hypothetical protein